MFVAQLKLQSVALKLVPTQEMHPGKRRSLSETRKLPTNASPRQDSAAEGYRAEDRDEGLYSADGSATRMVRRAQAISVVLGSWDSSYE